ncbi:uncharacterized protein FTOL_05604 [Fusarium torulosum]|uniref:Copper-fist domain-containing protein n=1 Tax=Fusarium torulosum TaxID=33205 RepID=A0AAE8M7T6_9HYPO|nr:uncharacterized protein FTOL_05604 [Fusarium torulosum]
MARTDIYGSAISCEKCKKGHRDASCNDSHPGPCFYRGKRGRPRKGKNGQVSGPVPVPDCLLRPSSGVPSGLDFSGQFAAGPPFPPPPTPPHQAVRHPHLGVNGSAASAAPPYFPPYAPSPFVPSPSAPDFSGQFAADPMFPAQIGGNGYDVSVALPYFSSGATSPGAFLTSGQPAALVPATSGGFFSSGEAFSTPAIPVEGDLLTSLSRDLALETQLEVAIAEEQGPQSSEMAPAVSSVPRLPDLFAESDATPQPAQLEMAAENWSLVEFKD